MAPTLDQDFRGSDDNGWVEDVPRRNTLAQIFDPYLITPNEGPSTYYIPLQSVVYLIAVEGFGREGGARALRATLLLSHLLAGWLLFQLLCRLLLTAEQRSAPPDEQSLAWERAAAAGAALFLIHPASLRTVSWIGAGVSHTLQIVLMLGCCLAWLGWARNEPAPRLKLALALLLGLAAALLKETAAVLPALLALLALKAGTEGASRPTGAWLRRMLLGLSPFVLLTGGIVFMQKLKYPAGMLSNRWGGISVGERVPLRILDLLTQLGYIGEQPQLLKLSLAALVMLGTTWAVLSGRRYGTIIALGAACLALVLPFALHNFRPVDGLWRYLYLPAAPGLAILAVLPMEVPAGLARRAATLSVAALAGSWLLWALHHFWQIGA